MATETDMMITHAEQVSLGQHLESVVDELRWITEDNPTRNPLYYQREIEFLQGFIRKLRLHAQEHQHA